MQGHKLKLNCRGLNYKDTSCELGNNEANS